MANKNISTDLNEDLTETYQHVIGEIDMAKKEDKNGRLSLVLLILGGMGTMLVGIGGTLIVGWIEKVNATVIKVVAIEAVAPEFKKSFDEFREEAKAAREEMRGIREELKGLRADVAKAKGK